MAQDTSTIYGSMVFNDKVMRDRLPKPVYRSLHETIQDGTALDEDSANAVAHAMKEWAIENGCTHYTHWFQPLTGITSEKHDAFIDPIEDGTAITSFSGKELIQGEPDASSFPSGGLRGTAEARGYTAWDPTSFAFIKDEVLCIPTAFISYTGESLDKKTPLLRSMKAVSDQAKRVLACFGCTDVPQVITTIGAEQEYFLVKLDDYSRRPDLIMCGRTLFGAHPMKGQELEEHYFGAIREVVSGFMKEVDDRLWRLGVDAKTKHNEVAPCQHELAPIFSRANVAADNNLLTMEILRETAPHHGLACLLNEKPFKGINGSGKHDNWSLAAPGLNMLNPGDDPAHNYIFLLSLAAVIQAVDDYQELLRATVASPGNDHRLGANEAPPAIVSIFLGDELTGIVKAIAEGKDAVSHANARMDLGSEILPSLDQDNTDRNRTSPFAFTGNRFEFRMPGSEINLSSPNTVINTAVAKSFNEYANRLEPAQDKEAEALAICREVFNEHRRIIFNGNGYSEEWPKEAERRGLANNTTTPDALVAYTDKKNIELMGQFGILSETEMYARYDVDMEHYAKVKNIEATCMLDMSNQIIMPAVIKYSKVVADEIIAKKAVNPALSTETEDNLLERLSEGLHDMGVKTHALHMAHEEAYGKADWPKRAHAYMELVVPAMDELRTTVDRLEELTDREYWPLPTYNDILFYV